MVKIRSEIVKWLFLLLLVTCVKCRNAELEQNKTNINWFEFEKIKNDLFDLTNLEKLNTKRYNLTANDKECLVELRAIGSGLTKKLWAIKLLDAWGKLPSGILEGNLIEFGGFSECFQIERDNKPYKTKYCMGQLAFDLSGILAPKTYQYGMNNNEPIIRILEFDDEPQVTPRMGNSMSLSFGLCVPAVCSLDFLKHFIMIKESNKVLTLPENSCQYEENSFKLKPIDWVALGLFAIVSILIVLSTSYDIFCMVYNREKSQALLAFSFYSNGVKLLSYKENQSPDMMNCLNGIRAISTQWVVIGHTFAVYGGLPVRNKAVYSQFVSRYYNMFILSAPIAVDTFFVLSGLLVSINMLKHLKKTKGKINIPMLYFHRYLRLTPLFGVAILFSMSLLRFMGSGPLWPRGMEHLAHQCEMYWWSALLYVQNYVNPNDICLLHSWYLSVDMQLFLISPFIVYLIYRFKSKALIVMVALILGCIGCTLALFQRYDFKGTDASIKQAKTYYPTHIRYSSWLVGVIAGYIFVNTRKRSIRIPRTFNLFAWALSLATVFAVIFVNYPLQQLNSKNTPLEYGLYDALSRVSWAIALCYIIFACINNSGGIFNWFLSHPLWQPISRLSYSIYIMHMLVIMIVNGSVKASIYFTELSVFHSFLGIYILSVFISILTSLAFESPIVVLEKLIFGPKKRSKPVDENKSNENNVNRI